MAEKLNCILLIDDDEATNFLHRLVLEDYGCAKTIVAVQKATEGLGYLTTRENDVYPQPDLIFLDINMPGMNGWEFLEAYEKLETNQKGGLVIVMLTTSLNPDDETAANTKEKVSGFLSKPLDAAKIRTILEKNFPAAIPADE